LASRPNLRFQPLFPFANVAAEAGPHFFFFPLWRGLQCPGPQENLALKERRPALYHLFTAQTHWPGQLPLAVQTQRSPTFGFLKQAIFGPRSSPMARKTRFGQGHSLVLIGGLFHQAKVSSVAFNGHRDFQSVPKISLVRFCWRVPNRMFPHPKMFPRNLKSPLTFCPQHTVVKFSLTCSPYSSP